MKIRLAKILVGVLLLAGIAVGQQYTGPMSSVRYPTNVVFISPNYTNKLPHYSSIANALSYLGNKATVQNPYVMWIDCDTSKISDWTTQKAALRSTYVSTGKIKIAGFFQEGVTGIVGGGGGDLIIPQPDVNSQYYGLWTWNPSDTTLPAWVPFIASNFLVIDEELYSGRNVGGSGIIIINDTVISVNDAYIEGKVADAMGDAPPIDSTYILYKNVNDTIRAIYIIKNGGLDFGDSSWIKIPLNNWSGGQARVLWGDSGNKLHFSGSGGESAYTTIPSISDDTGYLTDDTILVWTNLSQAVKDSIQWFPVFAALSIKISDPDTVVLAATGTHRAIKDFEPGVTKNITVTDSSFVIPEAGYYRVSFSGSIDVSATMEIHGNLFVNDIENEEVSFANRILNTDAFQSVSASGIMYLSTLDVLEYKLESESGTGTLYIRHGSFNIERIRD